ncbi:MAG: DUF1501 domain-containing protein [Planctomycetales bacterium]|nr:DUF1501 domain-containing protein [Planctomycetales bacterium]
MNQGKRTARACAEFRQAGWSRRQVLQAGVASTLGLGLPGWWSNASSAKAAESGVGFGQAKRCIFLFMWGGPSQLDTFDPKPDAPAEIRGQFQPIATKTPGLQFSEHFKHLATLTDKLAVIRSLGHDDPAHLSSGHATVTGHLAPVVRSDADPPSSRDTPHLGSLVSRLMPAGADVPSFVMMPWKAYHPAAPGGEAPGQHGGWLGPNYDPLLLTGDLNDPNWRPPALNLLDGVTPELLHSRHALLRHLDAQRAALQATGVAAVMSEQQQRAVDLLCSPKVREAFDLNREPAEMRERYGRNLHGQCVLLARRLLEHGVPLVTVNWQNDGKAFWDTHGDNFNRLKNDLIPPADQALAALLLDLESRGMLDDTIVAWVGEFGRRPQITAANAGREHWPYCYNGILAGGGIRGGAVHGSSDKHAAYPASDPVSPQDYAATILHALGISQHTVLHDRIGRPHRLYAGKPLESLFG